jgi:hypothetical protein
MRSELIVLAGGAAAVVAVTALYASRKHKSIPDQKDGKDKEPNVHVVLADILSPEAYESTHTCFNGERKCDCEKEEGEEYQGCCQTESKKSSNRTSRVVDGQERIGLPKDVGNPSFLAKCPRAPLVLFSDIFSFSRSTKGSKRQGSFPPRKSRNFLRMRPKK